jgi:O-antigen ligase
VNANRVALSSVLVPLLLGAAVGVMLVHGMGALSVKWNVFIVGAVIGICLLVVVGSLTSHLKGAMLFLAVLSLPTFYGIEFMFRERVPFSVLANGFPVYLFDVFFFPLFAAWIYELWSDPRHPPVYFPGGWIAPLGLLLLINLVSALIVAPEPFFSYSMLYLQLKSYLVVLYLANNIRDERTFRLIGYAFALVLIFEALVVLEQRFIGAVFTEENLGRATQLRSRAGTKTLVRLAGTLGHPNVLAMYLNLILPWVIFLFVVERRYTLKLMMLVAILAALTIEVWSGSRGGWLGLGIAMATGIFLWMRKAGKNPLIGLGAAGLLALIVFAGLFVGSSTFRDRLVEGDRGAAAVRFPLMEVATETIRQNPVLGVGLNNYTREMVKYDRTNLFIASQYEQPVHNTFLLLGAETGLPTLVIFAALIVLLVKEAYRVFRYNQGVLAATGIGILGMLLSWFIHNQFNQTAVYADTTLWLLLGVLAAAKNYTDRLTLSRDSAVRPAPDHRARIP